MEDCGRKNSVSGKDRRMYQKTGVDFNTNLVTIDPVRLIKILSHLSYNIKP